MTPRVVLLDIDGTLINCGGAGRRAMQQAAHDQLGREDVLNFRFGGLTDRLIARRALASAEQEPSDARIDALLNSYLAFLPEALTHASDYQVLPGAAQLARALRAESTVALGLGTGNVAVGARAKLSHGDLWDLFAFGGFGCDHEERSEILRAGVKRGAEHLAQEPPVRVYVVGDTPHDISAAHAIGALCLAVATGGFSDAELAAAGADAVVEDLSDGRVLDFLLGDCRNRRPVLPKQKHRS